MWTCRRQLCSTGIFQGMVKGAQVSPFTKAVGGHGIIMTLTFCCWDARVSFGQVDNKKHCKSYLLKGFLLAQGASHGPGDIKITNNDVSSCTAQNKIFFFIKHSTIHCLTVCSYEQQEGNIISTLNPNVTNHR